MSGVGELPTIDPPRARWEPNPNPESIAIPGLDTTAPAQDQIEYIEQMITIKLQNIDANFSEAQTILATKILPAFRRYAINTEPVRDAAKFWVQFFEQAAQIRIPTTEDDSVIMNSPSNTRTDAETETETATDSSNVNESRSATANTNTDASNSTFNPDHTPSDSSFLPGQAAVSSTPMALASSLRLRKAAGEDDESTASWAASLESPFDKLDRELQGLKLDENERIVEEGTSRDAFSMRRDDSQRPMAPPLFAPPPSSASSYDMSSASADQSLQRPPSRTAAEKGKGKSQSNLRQDILQQNAARASSNQSARTGTRTSPLKVNKPKTPKRPNAYNPYIPANMRPKDWDGIVDLAKSPLTATPLRSRPQGAFQRAGLGGVGRIAAGQGEDEWNSDEEAEEDAKFFARMSPPVTMDFARPRPSTVAGAGIGTGPAAGATLQIMKSPVKAAATRIMHDLIGDAEGRRHAYGYSGGYNTGGASAVESSMSTLPTPPSLSRYRRQEEFSSRSTSLMDASLENMLRRVGLGPLGPGATFGPSSTTSSSTLPSLPSLSKLERENDLLSTQAQLPPAQTQVQSKSFQNPRTVEGLGAPEDASAGMAFSLDPRFRDDDDGAKSDSDSFDEERRSGQPSAAFLMASQRRALDDDDSFGSSNHSSDSLSNDMVAVGEDDGAEGVPVIHPFARAFGQGAVTDDYDDSFDDSFDNPRNAHGRDRGEEEEEEPTVFGLPLAQRAAARNTGVGVGPGSAGQFRMLGQELLEDTVGYGGRLDRMGVGSVEDTPTPWGMTGRGGGK